MDPFVPFATPSDLTLQYDVRRVCELASDTGVPITQDSVTVDPNNPNKVLNPVVLYVLMRATETILMNARLGKRYTEKELVDLVQDKDHLNQGSELRGLCADLAFGYLVMRRGTGENDRGRLSPAFLAAQNTLALLARGEMVFSHTSTESQINAGTPETANLTTQPSSPTLYNSWSQQANLGLLPGAPITRESFEQA